MEQKFNAAICGLGFERDCICSHCGEYINHPISHRRLAVGFVQWLAGFPEIERDVNEKLKHFLKQVKKNNLGEVCPKCFSEYLFALVKESGAGVRVLSEFLFMFNFDFEHSGTFQELEAYGGY